MSLDVEFLETAARDGSVDCERWPPMVEPLIARLEEIVFQQFPMPKIPTELGTSFTTPSSSFSQPFGLVADNPLANNNVRRGNGLSSDSQLMSRVPESTNSSSLPTEHDPSSQFETIAKNLPPPLQFIYDSIRSTLRSYFSINPPHTVQRLAELILYPTHQYRTLPAYLRAVDRVVSVSSGANVFPLPQTNGSSDDRDLPNGSANGTVTTFMVTDYGLGSDESLGGALLTPIPWLTSANLEGADGHQLDDAPDSFPVREPGDLTQQEQVPGIVHQQVSDSMSGDVSELREPPPAEEIPYARGPSVLGVEDMGLQDGRGVQITLSNPNLEQDGTADATGEEGHAVQVDGATKSQGDDADGDGDIFLEDATGSKTNDNRSNVTRAEGLLEAETTS